MNECMEFKHYLKSMLETKNIKPDMLAHAINVDSSLVRKWLSGSRMPSLRSNYIELISNYLRLNEAEIDLLKEILIASVIKAYCR